MTGRTGSRKQRCVRCKRVTRADRDYAHASRSPFAIACPQCVWHAPDELHRLIHTTCPHGWHDFWDHETLSGPIAAILAVTSAQPAPLTALMEVEIGAPTTPRVLLESRHCTAPCMLALAQDSNCDCPCAGEFHGALTDAMWPDTGSTTPWPPPAPEHPMETLT